MEHALLVTVRFHEGRYHGLDNRKASEWPPAPARLFQALMAGASRGAAVPVATQTALDWLETLPPPVIAAPRSLPGQPFTSYVPNNDLDAELSKGKAPDFDKAVAATRVGKRIRPILFDAETPILYCWSFGDNGEHAAELCKAANGLYQLGRGIDAAWAVAVTIDSNEAERRISSHGGIVYWPSGGGGSGQELLCPRPGLRESLTARFKGMRVRFRKGGTNRKPIQVFAPPPNKPRLDRIAYNAPPQRFVFELRKADAQAAFAVRPLNSVADLVMRVRDKTAERLLDAIPSHADQIERYLIGRNAGEKDKATRVHIVPIPSVGHEHADMAIRRLAVYVPQACPLTPDDLAWAFSQVVWADADGVILEELQQVKDDRMVGCFERRGRGWRSVTPLALPMACRRRIDPGRQIDEAKGGAERAAEEARAAAAVHHALRHVGVRVPIAEVRVQREPFSRRGVRAERFASGTRFPKEALWHVSITFAEPVAGPVLLGDGRYLGLGLMHPDEPVCGVLAFAITDGLAGDADPVAVARAARRAMIARVQRSLKSDQKVPAYVSGHEENGSPVGGSVHRHIATVADLPRKRLLYIAPTWLQRRSVRWREIATNHCLTADALEGMDILRAGAAGLLALVPTILDTENDPLFAPACAWESVTDYHVARHPRRLGDVEALRTDVAVELDRRGWPRPQPDAIEVLAVQRGPRGGLSGRLRLTFRTAQTGPLLLGRTAHKGGGLFVGI